MGVGDGDSVFSNEQEIRGTKHVQDFRTGFCQTESRGHRFIKKQIISLCCIPRQTSFNVLHTLKKQTSLYHSNFTR